jgi:hypothetical protein
VREGRTIQLTVTVTGDRGIPISVFGHADAAHPHRPLWRLYLRFQAGEERRYRIKVIDGD